MHSIFVRSSLHTQWPAPQPPPPSHPRPVSRAPELISPTAHRGGQVGLPAKSGVAGCIMVVVPNVLGLAVLAPPLDKVPCPRTAAHTIPPPSAVCRARCHALRHTPFLLPLLCVPCPSPMWRGTSAD